MKPKADKSRSCFIVKGRSRNVQPFETGAKVIPSLQHDPVKTLGRVYDGSLSDRKAKDELAEKIKAGLKTIDRSLCTGVMKLFTYQSILLPRICWPIMIYEIPISWVTKFDKHICSFLRRWLGVSKSLSTVALFFAESPLPLPLSSLTTEYKRRKVGALVQLKNSTDPFVSENIPRLKTGRKFDVVKCLVDAESDVNIKK